MSSLTCLGVRATLAMEPREASILRVDFGNAHSMGLALVKRTWPGVILSRSVAGLLVVGLAACSAGEDAAPPPDSGATPAQSAVTELSVPETWTPPPVDSTPDDPFEGAVLR